MADVDEISLSRADIEEIVIGNASKHPQYREALIKNPKKVVEKQLNNTLPGSVSIEVVEESPTKIYLRLPYVAAEGAELSDEDLENVAGGKGEENYNCNNSRGGFNTRNEFSSEVSLL